MKKNIAIILAITFLFNTGGHYFWFLFLQNNIQREIKHELRKGLSDNELTLIKVPVDNESELNWIKPSKEFKYHNEMFDVVRTKIVGNTKYYYCINDKKEKKLITDYNKNNLKRKDVQKRNQRTTFHNYFSHPLLFTNLFTPTDFVYIGFETHYTSNDLKTPSPPPKQLKS